MTIAFFSEDRLFWSAEADAPASGDEGLAQDGWRRGLSADVDCRWVARTDRTVRSGGFVVQGEVVPLHSYHGPRELIRAVPFVIVGIARAVNRCGVVAVRLPGFIGLWAVLFARLRKRPIVVEVVGDVEDVIRAGTLGQRLTILAPLARRLIGWAVRQGDVVRFVTTERLQSRYPASRAAEVFAFSDVEIPEVASAPPAARSVGSPPVVLAVGSQEQMYKGHDVLIRALVPIHEAGVPARLRLIGDGVFQAQLRQLAEEVGVAGSVEFLGSVPRDRVLDELGRTDVFAMPSRTEGLPRALIEAMALGVACVGTHVGGIPELLAPDDLVRPDDVTALADRILRFLNDQDDRQRAIRRNERHIDAMHTEIARSGDSWRAAVERLCARSRGRSR